MATMKDIIQSPLLPVLVIMTVLSLAARLAGYGSALGGLVGIGTLVCAFCLGPFIQFFDGHFSQKVLKYKPVKE